MIKNGLDAVREKIASEKSKYDAVSEKYDWLCAAEKEVQAVLDFAQRYRDAARERGFYEIADTLENIPRKGAKTFREALQFFRILHFALWCEGEYHVIIGRFDKFMFPYLEEDMREGRLDEETAFELLLDFFLSFNKDSDLYPGMQQGDNGQSIMLGGLESDGTDSYNFLSGLCLKASLELKVIDPKINLRVSRTTPAERFEFASKLTATGIGFPQYANDDVVIPGLMKLGYGREDAYNYVVAAC